MPSLANHQSNDFVKLLLLGDSKSGKTGSLVSLVKAGYKLRILDLDNLLDVLKGYIERDCPENIGNVEFRPLRDKYKAGAVGAILDGSPKAWVQAIKMLDNWKYTEDGVETDLGKPSEWGKDCILVIDSLSRLCDAAYDFHESIIPVGKSGEFDGRAVYGNAQDDVEKILAMLTSKGMRTNIIVIAHGIYQELPDGTTKIFPQGVGQKLSPKIPQYFPSYVRYKNIGGKRTIQMKSDAMIDLASPRPFAMKDTYDIADGLGHIFAALLGPTEPKVNPVQKVTTLKRA